jgi:peptide/nickel transport system permease protein
VIVSVLVAVTLGLLLAEAAEKWWSRPVMGLLGLGISVPGFVVGILLIIAFAVEVHVLPSGGYVSFASSPIENLKDMVLPTVTLSVYVAPALTRFVRARSVEVLREEYIDVARSKGMSRRRLLLLHVAPNTAVMSLTYLGLQVGALLSGAIVTEVIFSLPGMGATGLNALLNRDYPIVQGVVLLVGAGYVIVNLVVDLVYGVVDPRIRRG